MTNFRISADDIAVRALQENNKTPVVTGPVLPVNATKPVEITPGTTPDQPNKSAHQNADSFQLRRRSKRRKKKRPVLLDTRSTHDRRTQAHKNKSENISEVNAARGIDETI